MSGDQHNQADPLDLDAIEARTATSPAPHRDDVRALVAEVRRLRAEVVRSRHPVSLVGPIPAPDYTMRVNFAHEPLPDRNTRATIVDCA